MAAEGLQQGLAVKQPAGFCCLINLRQELLMRAYAGLFSLATPKLWRKEIHL